MILKPMTCRTMLRVLSPIVLTFALCASLIAAPSDLKRIREEILNPRSSQVLVSAHRGLGGHSTSAWDKYPENSLAAFTNSIAIGVDIIEVDVRKTKDGRLILMHDAAVDRTTTGKGSITNMTFAEIRSLKLKTGIAEKGSRITEFEVPTLEEALLTVKGKCLINLDKVGSLVPECCEILKRTGTYEQAVFKAGSSPEKCYKDYGHLNPPVLFMPIVLHKKDWQKGKKHGWEELEPYSKLMRPCAFELVFAADDDPLASPGTIAAIKKSNARVWINTLWESQAGGRSDEKAVQDPEGNWGQLITRGANIIQTDESEKLLEYLRGRKLHW